MLSKDSIDTSYIVNTECTENIKYNFMKLDETIRSRFSTQNIFSETKQKTHIYVIILF